MNKDMKVICHEIQKGDNLEVNLPQFLNRLVNIYGQYAEVKFTMHYYTFYEYYLESMDVTCEEENLLEEFNEIIQKSLLSGFSGEIMESGVKRLDVIRKQIIKRMKLLTAYTDIFQIYEYVLNRIEYRFLEGTADINEEEFTAEVLRYIFDTKDNVIINDKIKDVIGQLPVRMTKSRYFDLLKDSISIYKNSDLSALEGFIYMIKTSSMLYKQEEMEESYPEFHNLKKNLEALDYANITKEEYSLYSGRITKVAEKINGVVDFYYGLQECVNHLYVMLITTPYAYMDGGYRIESQGGMKFLLHPHEIDQFKLIIDKINENFVMKVKLPLGEDLEAKMEYSEGKQELLAEEFEMLESFFSEIEAGHYNMIESLMMEPLFNSLSVAQKLLSNSLFIELDQGVTNQKVEESHILKIQDNLLIELSDLFQNNSKMICRAVMANTINKIPVFFQTVNDVKDYVKNSLDQCHDRAEKIACVNIIKTFLDN